MSNRFMRLLVFFDLPVETAENRRDYNRFRRTLIKSGFYMLQESVYVRMIITPQAGQAIMDIVRRNRPPKGLVQTLSVTEKQFAKMEIITGEYHCDVLTGTDRVVFI